jgi:hypothetical protein
MQKIPFISKFLEEKLEFLVRELALTKKQGYPSEKLQNMFSDLLKTHELKNFDKFLTLNATFYDSREFLH